MTNRLAGLHEQVELRHYALPRVISNQTGWGCNTPLVLEGAARIKGTVGELGMTREEFQAAKSILSTLSAHRGR